MDDGDWLAGRFEDHRSRLFGVAYRMLGSADEAHDAVQETWLRLSRSDSGAVENLGGWLTTVVAHVSLDILRARRVRGEAPATPGLANLTEAAIRDHDPESDAILADSVGSALLVVLDTLSPAERLAFILHDTFNVPHEQIGAILGRSTAATKQLASRARQKVRGSDRAREVETVRHREIVDAFLTASRAGRFDALLALLAPDVVLEADATAIRLGAPAQVVGADGVAAIFAGRAKGAQPALVDSAAGMVWMVGGHPRVVWVLTISDDEIVHIDMLADRDALLRSEVQTSD